MEPRDSAEHQGREAGTRRRLLLPILLVLAGLAAAILLALAG
jgi:hypothetical protein